MALLYRGLLCQLMGSIVAVYPKREEAAMPLWKYGSAAEASLQHEAARHRHAGRAKCRDLQRRVQPQKIVSDVSQSLRKECFFFVHLCMSSVEPWPISLAKKQRNKCDCEKLRPKCSHVSSSRSPPSPVRGHGSTAPLAGSHVDHVHPGL